MLVLLSSVPSPELEVPARAASLPTAPIRSSCRLQSQGVYVRSVLPCVEQATAALRCVGLLGEKVLPR